MTAVILFTIAASTVVLGVVSPIVHQLQGQIDLHSSKQSYFTAEAGSEDVYYRIRNNIVVTLPVTMALAGATSTTTVTPIGSNEKEIFSQGNNRNLIRSVVKRLTVTDGFAFNFAVQVGPGGLRMLNNSDIIGNVYSDGPILGDSSGSNTIAGDAVSTGNTGSIGRVHATSSLYASSITNSIADKDAYYQTIDVASVVKGTKYPGSSNQISVPMPISDSLLDQWEGDATAGGVINTCPYVINSSTTIGPNQINCDVTISGNSTVVTLVGTVWINGNLTISGNPTFKVNDSVGNNSVTIIVDKTSNRVSGGTIGISNNPMFYGSNANGIPNADSYVMLISRNTGAESGGAALAISVGNNVTGRLLLYAPHGEVSLSNNVILREVTSYKLTLSNNVQVIYSTGLAQPLFSSGPGGKWKIKRWRESK